MTAHQLAKKLLTLPDYEIIMSSDTEGNGYNTIEDDRWCFEVMDKPEDYGAKKNLIILKPDRERLELDEV